MSSPLLESCGPMLFACGFPSVLLIRNGLYCLCTRNIRSPAPSLLTPLIV
jgi:hypothetical protein